MNRSLHRLAFAAGLLAIAWVGAGYVPGSPLALGLVLLIGGVYLAGAAELQRFQQATQGLARQVAATQDAPPALEPWLATLDASLRPAVRLRVEGDRVALPGPAFTPTLAGLLVLLGMLGTFLGMVVTLRGTGLALEHAADAEAIRASLAAPVKGLGLAFGTSVAGVAASAMLGLMSALARRERQHAAQQLDACIASTLRGFSRVQQREESLRLQRLQAETLPALADQLQALMLGMDRQDQDRHQRLLESQQRWQGETQRAYAGLAESVGRSLQSSLAESARLAGAAIEPAVQATMTGLARETATLHATLSAAVQQQGQALTQGLLTAFERQAGALLHSVAQAHDTLEARAAQREKQGLAQFHDSLSAMADAALRQGRQAAADAAAREAQICATLESTAQAITVQVQVHAAATLDELARLAQQAAEAPRAAGELVIELRRAASDVLARDTAALDERQRLLGELAHVQGALQRASVGQQAAIEGLAGAAAQVLERVGARFTQNVEEGSHALHSVAAQVTGSAAEVASLGEGFGLAVQLFSRASEQLLSQLQRIEQALDQSMARSDEQLAWCVAQARELIDLTLGSQRQMVDEMQQVARTAQIELTAPVAPRPAAEAPAA
jgi:hypothetical protein